MIWEHDHVCGHAEDIVVECGGELEDGIRSGLDYEEEEINK